MPRGDGLQCLGQLGNWFRNCANWCKEDGNKSKVSWSVKCNACVFFSKDPSKTSQMALRLLSPWQERFAVCQEEAIANYNEPFGNKNWAGGLMWISWIFGWLTPHLGPPFGQDFLGETKANDSLTRQFKNLWFKQVKGLHIDMHIHNTAYLQE